MSGASAVESVAWNNPIDTGKLPENGASFDTIVVGGGPGGASAAGYLAMGGQRVLLIEKDIWPRDKICGDAVGGKSLSHVQRLGVKEHLEQTPHFRVTGILFSSPKGHEVRVALPEEDVARLEAGYALPREQFDTLLFREVQSTVRKAGGAVIQGGDVRQVLYDDGNGGEDPGPKVAMLVTARGLLSGLVEGVAKNLRFTLQISLARQGTVVRSPNPCLRKPTKNQCWTATITALVIVNIGRVSKGASRKSVTLRSIL
jgi:hypothetical protein